jgi:hypothetical protein
MPEYKRGQIVDAILRVCKAASVPSSPEMLSQLKRLLDTDRRLGQTGHSANREYANFAFYSADRPGRGIEVQFSAYEAFALLIGLRLMQHSWRQGHVVAVLRRLRPELEKLHADILGQDPAVPFDQRAVRQQAKPGVLAVTNTNPVFLAISGARKGPSGTNPVAICRGQDRLMEFIRAQELGQTSTVCELVSSAHALACTLAETRPSKRGRGSE